MGQEPHLLAPAAVFPEREIYLGAHLSIAGGLERAVHRASSIGATALQIFTKNQRRWAVPELSSAQAENFRAAWREWGPYPVLAHDAYLINLASPKPAIAEKSVRGFAVELARAESLGLNGLVAHPGSHLGTGEPAGLRAFAANMDRAMRESGTRAVPVLLECTAGQGTNLGRSFEQLGEIVRESRHAERLGICIDTCHVFAAGYPIDSPEGYERVLERIEACVGLQRVGCFHLNDSKQPSGSRKDRHEHIGSGSLGLRPFSLILNDPRFRRVPKILETPKGTDMREDRENMHALLSLLRPEQAAGRDRSRGAGPAA
jgi:deoxyribonuclease-4